MERLDLVAKLYLVLFIVLRNLKNIEKIKNVSVIKRNKNLGQNKYIWT